jgi:hypothetical protein
MINASWLDVYCAGCRRVKPVDPASVDSIRKRVTAEFNGGVGLEFQPDGWPAICAPAQHLH